MILDSARIQAVKLVNEAVSSGAPKFKACRELGISVRTYQRWTVDGNIKTDGRPISQRPEPKNKLSKAERDNILAIVNSDDFKSLPPSQIVPTLADEGIYLASESTYYRVLHEEKQQNARGRSQIKERKVPTTHCATGPNQVWCWDITWLPGPAKGLHFYLYLILDIFSRKIVGWEIHDDESAENASILIKKAHLKEGVKDNPLVLHSDNGSPMKGSSMLETLYSLGVVSSFNRPKVSNDNAYAESIFKTCKYRPDYPYKGFSTIDEARSWVLKFSHWYNFNHKHSGIKYVSPHQRHSGLAGDILANRKEVYQGAKDAHPERWSGNIRNWDLPKEVYLNPEQNSVKAESA